MTLQIFEKSSQRVRGRLCQVIEAESSLIRERSVRDAEIRAAAAEAQVKNLHVMICENACKCDVLCSLCVCGECEGC
jgi:hypothetical protein